MGMYRKTENHNEELFVKKAKEILSSSEIKINMKRVTEEWPFSTDENFTNIEQNRRAWLGQATCCLVGGVTETETRMAWMLLSDYQRFKANEAADAVISEWENKKCQKNTLQLTF